MASHTDAHHIDRRHNIRTELPADISGISSAGSYSQTIPIRAVANTCGTAELVYAVDSAAHRFASPAEAEEALVVRINPVADRPNDRSVAPASPSDQPPIPSDALSDRSSPRAPISDDVSRVFHTLDVIREVVDERQRQVNQGYGPAHDDVHRHGGELASAAAAHAEWASEQVNCLREPGRVPSTFMVGVLWPFQPRAWVTHDPRADLVTAAALIVAEIERIDRANGREA